jgi:tripartite-type tricarboxylate transporter receptor subunit TctC
MKKLLATFILAVTAITVSAAEEFNLRKDVITIVVPSSPGGVTSILSMKLSQLMKEKGVTILVVNKPGSNKTIGTNFVAAHSAADGRTLLVAAAADITLLPQQYPDVVKFNKNSFVPVFSMATGSPAIAVRSNFPANNLKEFLDVIRKDPLQRQVGSYSVLSELISSSVYSLAGTNPEFIPYPGEEKALIDLVSGNLQAGIFIYNEQLRSFVSSKKIKMISMVSEKRNTKSPTIETVSETFPNVKFQYWWGLYAPAGTPQSTIQALNQAFAEAWSDPVTIAELEAMNYRPGEMSLPLLNVYLDNTYKTLELMSSRYLK